MTKRVNSIKESRNPRAYRNAPKTTRRSVYEAEDEDQFEDAEDIEIEDEDFEDASDEGDLKDNIIDLVNAAIEQGVITADDLGEVLGLGAAGDEDEDDGEEDDLGPMDEARKVVRSRMKESAKAKEARKARIAEAKERIRKEHARQKAIAEAKERIAKRNTQVARVTESRRVNRAPLAGTPSRRRHF